MDLFNVTHDFYPTFPVAGGFDTDMDFNLASAIQSMNIPTLSTSDDKWIAMEQPSAMAGPPVDLFVEGNYNSVAPATPQPTQTYAHCEQPDRGQRLPEGQPQPRSSSLANWDGSIATGVASEPDIPAPAPRNCPLNPWVDNQSEHNTFASFPQDVHTCHQLRTGATRTKGDKARRFLPYGTHRAPGNEYVTAEAGPSTSTLLLIQSVGSPTTQPSGGESETAAGAAKNQTDTEENKAPKAKRTRAPDGQGKPRTHRIKFRGTSLELRKLIYERSNPKRYPNLNNALIAAIREIQKFKKASNKSWFRSYKTKDGNALLARGKKGRDQRAAERKLFMELSRYYPRSKGSWARSKLLSEVLQDLGNYLPADEVTPGAITPTTEVPESNEIPGHQHLGLGYGN